MPIDPTKLANLLAEDAAGERIACAEYIKVTWDTGVINYYGSAAWHEMPPFTGIGQTIEARLLPQSKKDPFHNLEINPDLRTENISITFDDIDGAIRALFRQYSSGVECELFLYYPSQDLTVSAWFGQLDAPQVYGHKTTKAVMTNGFRSRELTIPSRRFPRECTANIFAGQLPDADAVRSSLCAYDRHVGGTIGNYITGTTPYASCPKLTVADCLLRIDPHNSEGGNYFGGFSTDASAVITDANTGWLAVSRSNASNLKETLPVVFGTRWVRKGLLLLWRREHNTSNPGAGFVAGVWAFCEGPVQNMYNFVVGETLIGYEHQTVRLGERGQPRTTYAPDVANYSSTAHIFGRWGRLNANTITPSDMVGSCVVKGFREVCVYTDDDPLTKTREWSDNRVWCLLELYKNQKFGLGYIESRFTIADWMTAATWSDASVTFTATFPDGENVIYTGRRSSFNVIIEGRPVAEVVEDICRAGAISVPFQHESELTISTFRVATAGELSAARVYTDNGQDVNIIWDGGQPLLELSQTPDNKVVNEVEVRFEEAANNDIERPITVDDPNQKLKAGRQLGADYSLAVPKRFSAFGINGLAEAVRFAYRLLRFGEYDSGGTLNNLKVKITVPFEQVLGVKRYEIIKIKSDLLDGFTIGYGDTLETIDGTAGAYFRVLSMKKISGGRAEITAQAYNHTAYTAFEVAAANSPFVAMYVTQAGSAYMQGSYGYAGQVDGKPSYALDDTYYIRWNTTQWEFTDNFATIYYYSTDAVDFPNQVTTWVVDQGLSPVPVVRSSIPVIEPPEEIALDTLSYDNANQVINVPIL